MVILRELMSFLRGRDRVAVICLGNVLMGDDGAALELCKLLRGEVKGCDIYEAYQAPEAILPSITGRPYSHVIIVDAADMGLRPGEVRVIKEKEVINEGTLVTTHYLPLPSIINLLKESGKEVLVVGIQPKEIKLGGRVSGEVLKGVESLARTLRKALSLTYNNGKEGWG